MMSKNSFLVSMKENNKRRLWVWVVAVLAFALLFPVMTALMVNNIISSTKLLAETYEASVLQQILHDRLINGMKELFGLWGYTLFASAAIAIISAVQGFSYLYSRKKIDFYMGMPVKRKRRFLVIWLDGILLYILPYLTGLLVGLLIAAGNGAVNGEVLHSAGAAFLTNVLFYLGVYHMAVLAVMLTGNIVITGFAILVFGLYEFAVRLAVQRYQALFFKYFSYYGSNNRPLLSPFGLYIDLVADFNSKNTLNVKYLAGLLLFALAIGLLSYFCYLKRPAEAAGRAMTFEITKPFIKVLLVVPASLLAGLSIEGSVNFIPEKSMEGIGWIIFAIAAVLIIGCAVIQVIYEFDIKGAVHRKRHILISGVITALIFLVFRYDIFGYDGYIPARDKIESIAFVPEYYEDPTYSTRFDEQGNYMSYQNYADRYMYLTNVADICELAENSMEEYDKIDRYNYSDESKESDAWWSYTTVIYRLKSGRQVSRSLWVNVEDEQTARLLDKIIGSEEFKKGYFSGASDNIVNMVKSDRYQLSATFGNTIYQEKMSREQIEEFLEAYRKDLESADFSSIKESVPVGIVTLYFSEVIAGSNYMGNAGYVDRVTRGWDVGMNIYPFYKESIACLKKNGCYTGVQLKWEDVEKIQVMNGNYDIAERLQKQLDESGDGEETFEDPNLLLERGATQNYFGYDIDTRVYEEYTDQEKIKEIVSAVFANELVRQDWDNGKALDDNYSVIVYFKTDSPMTRNYGASAEYGFLEGQIPGFVKEDTIYKE
ncbi:MAG: hypothetical protein K2O16_13025 [Lachnospiraceae bacterium]|nr:hypothetical protein [Lachnospiraceae bacterium]